MKPLKRIRRGEFITPELFHRCTIPHGYDCFRLYCFPGHPFDRYLRKHRIPRTAAPARRLEKMDWSALARGVAKSKMQSDPAVRFNDPRFVEWLAQETGFSCAEIGNMSLRFKSALLTCAEVTQLERRCRQLRAQNSLTAPRRDNLRCIRQDLRALLRPQPSCLASRTVFLQNKANSDVPEIRLTPSALRSKAVNRSLTLPDKQTQFKPDPTQTQVTAAAVFLNLLKTVEPCAP